AGGSERGCGAIALSAAERQVSRAGRDGDGCSGAVLVGVDDGQCPVCLHLKNRDTDVVDSGPRASDSARAGAWVTGRLDAVPAMRAPRGGNLTERRDRADVRVEVRCIDSINSTGRKGARRGARRAALGGAKENVRAACGSVRLRKRGAGLGDDCRRAYDGNRHLWPLRRIADGGSVELRE